MLLAGAVVTGAGAAAGAVVLVGAAADFLGAIIVKFFSALCCAGADRGGKDSALNGRCR